MPATPEVWLDEFQVNFTDIGNSGDDQREPVVIQLTTGNIVVLWEDNSDGGPGGAGGTDILGQVFDPLGNKLGAEFRANNSFIADDEGDFDAVALPDGGFVVVFEDDSGSGQIAIRASEWSSTAAGAVFSGSTRTIRLDPTGDDRVGLPSVDAFSDGRYVVAYEYLVAPSTSNQSQTRYKIVEANGTVGPEVTALTGSESGTSDTDVAVLSNGNFAMVYDYDRTDDAIAYRVFDSTGGNVVSANFVADTSTNGDIDSDASIVALTGGGFVVAWTNFDTDTDIEFQRYDNSGVAQGGVVSVEIGGASDNDNEPHLIALADGGFVVGYDDDADGSAKFERYDSAGALVANFVTVTSTGIPTGIAGVGLEDGRFVYAWTDTSGGNSDILATIYDPRDVPNSGVYSPDGWTIGTVGNDTMPSSFFIDIVAAWDGNDVLTLASGAGTPDYDGGKGFDQLDFSNFAFDDFYVDLATGGYRFGFSTPGSFDGTITSVESYRGGGGTDVVIGTSGSNTLFGLNGNDTLDGGGGDDTLDGGANDDLIDGGTGADTMRGRFGNDRYVIDNAGDTVIEQSQVSGGFDAVISAGTVNLTDASAFQGRIEAVTLNGNANANAIGNIVANVLTGNAGQNVLNGLAGADAMRGRGGSDTYVFDNVGDTADETIAGSSGFDRILSSVSVNLSNTAQVRGAIERVELTGGSNVNAIGNLLQNSIVGNSGNNVLNGLAGNDVLTGGNGADAFAFTTAIGPGNVDTITDYNVFVDRIWLDDAVFSSLGTGPLSAGQFRVFGTGAQDGNDYVLYNPANGALYYDADAAGGNAAVLFARLSSTPTLDAGDFLVV